MDITQVSAGYKLTDLGVLPEDWEVKSLGDLTQKVGSGITPTGGNKVYKTTGRPFVRSQNVGWGVLLLEDIAFLDEETHNSFISSEIKENDVLLNITGASIGRAAIADAHIAKGNVNQHVCIIRPAKGQLDPKYLCSFLLSEHGQKKIDSFQAGGNRQGLNFQQIKSIITPLPPLAEQQAIAAALGEMDALLAAQRVRLAKQRAVKQGLLQGLLSGKQRLPGFAGDWEVTTVNSLSTVSKGTQLHNSKMGSNGGFAHLNGGINPSGFTAEANTKGNTIAISEGGNSCGYVQFMALPFWCGGHCYTVTPKRSVDNDFLYHALKGEQENIMALRVGSGLPNVQKTALLNLKLKIPITLAEQRAIADVLSEADAYLAALEAEHAKTQLLKQGMMQNLLTGKLRLV